MVQGEERAHNRLIQAQGMNGLSTSTRNHHMMRVLRVSQEAVEEAAEVVKNGGLVVYPTDTVYGLGCNPFDEDAVRRLINAKRDVASPSQ